MLNPNVFKEWQKAILRDDIKLKPSDVDCSLHSSQKISASGKRLLRDQMEVLCQR